MASKESWSTRVRHDTDATYREWRDELITKLGLLVTAGTLAADETNITPGAGARAGTSAEQGYAVYHINDSLHGTAPVYIRFGFGTGTATSAPRIQVTTGTSTNGSGVLGGTALSTIANIHSSVGQATDTVRPSYMCAVAGFFGLSWKQGSGNSEAFFFIARTVNTTGAISATGAIARWGLAAALTLTKAQAFRYAATAAAYTAQTAAAESMLGFFATAQATTSDGTNIQAAVAYTVTPLMQPIVGVMGVLDAEVPAATEFPCTPVGTTSRNYIALTTSAGPFGPGSSAGNFPKFAMLWE